MAGELRLSEMLILTKDSARRVRRAVERDESRPYGEQPATTETRGSSELRLVQITSTTQTAGRYPGSLYLRDGNADTFTLLGTAGTIWVDTPNGETLATGTYYWAKVTGVRAADSRLIVEAVAGSASSSTFSGALVTTIAPGGTSTVAWNQGSTYDTGTYFSNLANTRFTITTTGYYLLVVNLDIQNGGQAQVKIKHGGSSVPVFSDGNQTLNATPTTHELVSVSVVARSGAGNYFYVEANPNGSYATVVSGTFSITKLG